MFAWDPTPIAIGIIIVCAAGISVCLGIVTYWLLPWPKPKRYEPMVLHDWSVMGPINAVCDDPQIMGGECDDVPAAFMVLMQEERSVADISGAPVKEMRWRMATRAEVRVIVSRYNNLLGKDRYPHTQIEVAIPLPRAVGGTSCP